MVTSIVQKQIHPPVYVSQGKRKQEDEVCSSRPSTARGIETDLSIAPPHQDDLAGMEQVSVAALLLVQHPANQQAAAIEAIHLHIDGGPRPANHSSARKDQHFLTPVNLLDPHRLAQTLDGLALPEYALCILRRASDLLN